MQFLFTWSWLALLAITTETCTLAGVFANKITPTDIYIGLLPSRVPEVSICSFNVRDFGITKRNNKPVMDTLIAILQQFDIVCIQELSVGDSQDAVALWLLDALNRQSRDKKYGVRISDTVGQHGAKEQIAFYFNTASVQADSCYTTSGSLAQSFSRSPFTCHFVSQSRPDFNFALIGVHLSPGGQVLVTEMSAMPSVYNGAVRRFPGASLVMIIGDTNADKPQLTNAQMDSLALYTRSDKYLRLIPSGHHTMVRQPKPPSAYDQFILDQRYQNAVIAGSAGVYEYFNGKIRVALPGVYDTTTKSKSLRRLVSADKVSDHMPITVRIGGTGWSLPKESPPGHSNGFWKRSFLKYDLSMPVIETVKTSRKTKVSNKPSVDKSNKKTSRKATKMSYHDELKGTMRWSSEFEGRPLIEPLRRSRSRYSSDFIRPLPILAPIIRPHNIWCHRMTLSRC